MSTAIPQVVKEKYADEITKLLILNCRSCGVDYLSLDKNTRMAIFTVFIAGVRYAKEIL